MRPRIIAGVVLFSVLSGTAERVLAQSSMSSLSSTPAVIGFPLVGPANPGGWGGWGYYSSSTTAEGYWRGLGDFARGAGEFNLYTSLAMANAAEARRRDLENQRLAVENYFKLQQINRAAREGEHARKLTPEQLVRLSKVDVPPRPKPEQFDPRTGIIYWPDLLRSDEYASVRDRMETLFAHRTPTNSGVGTVNYREIERTAEAMRDRMRKHIKGTDPMEYIAAKKFIDSLAYEARFVPDGQTVATR